MPVEKVSLSLDADVVAEARAASGGNLSAYVNEALEARQRNRRLGEVLDEMKHEFEPGDPQEDERIVREFDEARAQARAAHADLQRLLVDGTDALNEHPLVEEAVIAMSPVHLPVAYVAVADDQQTIGAVVNALDEHLRQRCETEWTVQFVIVSSDPDDRAPLAGVVPL